MLGVLGVLRVLVPKVLSHYDAEMRLSSMIAAVDLHACGEPGRVIVGGVRDVPGRSMFEKMQHLARHQDGLRLRMLREPRGYPAANCNLVLPPTHPEADAGPMAGCGASLDDRPVRRASASCACSA